MESHYQIDHIWVWIILALVGILQQTFIALFEFELFFNIKREGQYLVN
jgi:hypothetical protein